ncbi:MULTISPECIES: stage V sporulation protein AC [Alteribacter]|uniref:Stage V sporulation protein AC n=1 Tax=Alteribacter keqinensis TaxID=2483800 RepID=A0A3M7TTU3_9BACI|nr:MULTISPECIES: stage V sporulation protein AC [Alteribacter]MBM7094738.1 stage V sporulation protein AC [Alteribacter salitolerans]RNA69066.1 stage V sporulation protein AC [Alteribacter keqinensis]
MKSAEQIRKDRFEERRKKLISKTTWIKNCLIAFAVGGILAAFGQWLFNRYIVWFGLTEREAVNPVLATFIFLSCLLTGIGIFDKLSEKWGAGLIVPVTGFANSVTSSGMESRAEGIVFGVTGNMFRIAGVVLVFGVVSAYLVSFIRVLIETLIR